MAIGFPSRTSIHSKRIETASAKETAVKSTCLSLFPLLVAFHFTVACTQEDVVPNYDVAILGARVVDPESGFDEVVNIGIRGNEIAAITQGSISGIERIDAKGLIAAPGFIDLHVHGQDPYSTRLGVLDGRTSQLDLEAGALPVSDFYEYKAGKSISNYGASVGHTFARVLVMDGIESHGIGLLNHTLEKTGATGNKWSSTLATDEQLDRIDDLVVRGLSEGGLGIGVLPGYFVNARSDGLARMAKIARDHESFLTTHARYISLTAPSGVLGIQEMISLATSYGVPLLVHHVPTNALAGTGVVLDMIEAANRNGAQIVGEMFPYVRGSTFIATTILNEGWQERMDMDYSDLQWVETGETLTEESFEIYRNERPEGYFIMEHIKEEDMKMALVHPDVIVGSDGMVYVDEEAQLLPHDAAFGSGLGHPRGAGTHGKYLRLAIDDGSLSMAQILAKTSYLPAAFLESSAPSMKRRGRLQVGMFADITVFDPETVSGVADYTPGTGSLPSEGFLYVFVNGQIVVRKGTIVENVFPGEPIRGEQTLN
jgi:N-acyl-D-aspartate/D-glutamate deacylase